MGLLAILVEFGLDAVSIEILFVQFGVVLAVVFIDIGGWTLSGCCCRAGGGCWNRALLGLLEVVDLLFSCGWRRSSSGGGGGGGCCCCGRYRWNGWYVNGASRWGGVDLFLRFVGLLDDELEQGFFAEGVRFEGRWIVLIFRDKGREFLDRRRCVVVVAVSGNSLVTFICGR